MRARFDQQLEQLHHELLHMGELCQRAIYAASRALLENDEGQYNQVRTADQEIDQQERAIETLCLKLLMMQQPVARDLRVISSAIKMISDMERIGDQAADIAEISRYVHVNGTKSQVHIVDMSTATIKMVTDSINSFVEKDIELARAVMAYDDVVDRLFDQVKAELIALIGRDESQASLAIDLLMVAKYFERIGDHAVNIAEWVEFSLTGQHPRNAMLDM